MKREAVQTERDRISRVRLLIENRKRHFQKFLELLTVRKLCLMRFYFQRPNPRKPLNPEDDLSMDILRRAEKLANDQYPEASRDPHKSKA